MPQNALENVAPDHVVTLAALGPLLYALACRPAPSSGPPAPDFLVRKKQARAGERAMKNLQAIASPSIFTGPDCGGVLFEPDDKHPGCYRCHIGHGFSLLSLAATQEGRCDAALWASLRTLREKEAILRRLAQEPGAMSVGQPGPAG